MLCQACKQPKNELHPRKSDLMRDVELLVCPTCKENKIEPRAFIVIVSRSKGPEFVAKHIQKRMYVGPVITGEELLA